MCPLHPETFCALSETSVPTGGPVHTCPEATEVLMVLQAGLQKAAGGL